jgi:hypothetical protein
MISAIFFIYGITGRLDGPIDARGDSNPRAANNTWTD